MDLKSKGLSYSSIQKIGKEYEGDSITEKKTTYLKNKVLPYLENIMMEKY
ncbi:hypothetical protein H477_4237 [[Clostridium] sordellii ATCC 9714]|nr:hypothetical protein H477_4237 [[Clostridium] sordellii ATCC 9714] [Paeniclostridium sordellii ATCC 9714]